MDFARVQLDAGEIALADWLQIITDHPALDHMPDREGINPFSQERVIFPGEGKAYYIAEGKRRGNAVLQDGQILTTGIPLEVCQDIARQTSGQVFEDDRS